MHRFIDSTIPRCYVLTLPLGPGRSVSTASRRVSERRAAAETASRVSRIRKSERGTQRQRAGADVAQEVEQLTCNQQVVGSTPTIGSSEGVRDGMYGTERCPSGQREQTVNLPAYAFGGSNPPLSMERMTIGGSSSVGRARAFQARGRGFESRFPLYGSRCGWRSCFLRNRRSSFQRSRGPGSSVGRARPW